MPTQPFWPDNAAEWAGMLTGLILFALTIGGLLIKMGRQRQRSEDQVKELRAESARSFEDQGRRIGLVEERSAGTRATMDELKLTDIQHHLQLDTNTREVTRCTSGLEKLDSHLELHMREAGVVERQVRERLARIEERLRLPIQES